MKTICRVREKRKKNQRERKKRKENKTEGKKGKERGRERERDKKEIIRMCGLLHENKYLRIRTCVCVHAYVYMHNNSMIQRENRFRLLSEKEKKLCVVSRKARLRELANEQWHADILRGTQISA